jgi:Predicted membrane protein (DUF2157)
MKKLEEASTQALFEKNVISETQFNQIKAYRSLNIFSLHNELRFLLYLSITLFTSGVGILIYQNMDSIGHVALLSVLFLIIVVCFYFCFKNAPNFKKQETKFENSLFDYLLLLANILTCTFIGYLQYQYKPFGAHYGLATLVPTIISFAVAYYFDNKSCLSIAITGLVAYIGLSVSPQTLLNDKFFSTSNLSYSAITLGLAFILWAIYCDKIDFKKHFKLVFITFSLHLISIACINNLFEPYWPIFMLIMIASTFYFLKTSNQIQSISLFVFIVLYGYIGLNIALFKIIEIIDSRGNFWIALFYIMPIYFILSIVYFIKLIKNFKKETAHDIV